MSKFENIPPEIAVKLDSCLGRIRRILLMRGICSAFAVSAASVLAVMAVDAMVTVYASWIRWTLWSFCVGATVSAVRAAIVKPLSRRFTAEEIAFLVERNHPEHDERLSTVVGLAGNAGPGVSPRLMKAITAAAIEDAAAVSPGKEFTVRSVKPRLAAAAVPAGIFAFLFIAFPDVASRLAIRALVPFAEVANIYASSLKVSPGDAVLLEGSSLTVNLSVEGGFPAHAFVRTRFDGRRETVERMSRIGEKTAGGPVFYSFTYPRAAKSFTYRVNCGRALTRGYRVTVVPEPSYVDRSIRIVHPAYTGRGSEVYTNSADIVALAGSKAEILARIARPGIEGEIRLSKGKVPGKVDEKGNIAFSFDIDDDASGAWSSVLWDQNGFTNVVDESSVTVLKDAPPEVALVSPSPEKTALKLPRTGSLPVEFTAKDDFGISRAVLEFSAGTDVWKPVQEVRTVKSDLGYDGSHTVCFLDDTYRNALVLKFRVRVEDNLPAELGGPGVACTPEITVEILENEKSGAETLERQELAERVKKANKGIAGMIAELRNAEGYFKDAGSNYREPGKNAARRKETALKSRRARVHVVKAESLLREFIGVIHETALKDAEEIFRSILNDDIVPIRKGAEDVLFESDDTRAADASQKLAIDTDRAVRRIEEARRRFGVVVKKAEKLQRAKDLLRRKEALERLAKKNRIDGKTLAEEKKKLQRELKDKKLREEVEKAEELKKRAAKGSKNRKESEKEPRREKSGVDENWFKVKGKSGSGAQADALDDVPAEYRSLVRDYFKALNEEGGK